ncbi:hypothetical protein AGMMS50230_22490 [Spirochaetia bacterium]|nr:hypothetical protein AGMMS50230_22490 [Spirochaetia bacterium]
MIRKLVMEEKNGCFTSYDQYIHEPITSNIGDAISDFYNMMHLIENSLDNEKYCLKMRDAGYDIYNKENEHEAWIGIFEKRDSNDWPFMEGIGNYLVFMVFYNGKMAKKIWDRFDADGSGTYCSILYSKLKLSDISKEKTEEKQREIIQTWINETLEKLV